MKKFIILGVIILAGGITVYATGLYTYFIRTDVQDELPTIATIPAPVVAPITMNTAVPVQTPAPQQPQTLLTGMFQPVDVVHKGSGDAKIILLGDKRILRLENFSVTSGPDLYVYLSKTEKPTGDIESLGDFIDLGLLKGTSGNQNYSIPPDANDYTTAVVWCKRFGVLFTYAVMK